ncbi:unnamed protein product [Hyaloperonospora brassicae]|uniref:RWP-RK domain-containing protein n=1 Tax=Hyaloperonospora brassicae TaxID=162125 RepID=A0AAV0V2V9_HYABA|nr:unnamed protein product [Hyaloperonospora brassicae]
MPSPPVPVQPLMTSKDATAESSSRKSRLKYDFPLATLVALSHFRQDEAAKILGVASITLKRNCQRRNYRWPYRTIKAKRRREAHLAAKPLSDDPLLRHQSLPAPEILLSLRHVATNCSRLPTSAQSFAAVPPNRVISAPIAVPRSTAHVSRTYTSTTLKLPPAPPQLPPLKVLLQNLKQQSLPATPPRLQAVPFVQYHHPVEHKSSTYSASFHSDAPKFPLRNLSALADRC